MQKKGSLKAKEEIILDENILAKGHEYFAIGGLSISPDNKWLAYGVDTVSRRVYEIHFKNLKTGKTLPATIKIRVVRRGRTITKPCFTQAKMKSRFLGKNLAA